MSGVDGSFPAWSALARHWTLDPGVVFLNHGSFGACPRDVLAAQQAFRDRLEAEPVRFFVREYWSLLDESAEHLARFVGAEAEDIGFVPNATFGINTALRFLPMGAGDEIVTSDTEYAACNNALEVVASERGARVVRVRSPWPIADPGQVVEAYMSALTPRTRYAMVSHVCSPTGVVAPLGRMVAALRERGVETIVDGAHGVGMLDLDIGGISPAFYTANLHKWVCTPKGSGFIWVRRDMQRHFKPLVVGHGHSSSRTDRSRFRLHADWMGTHDTTAYLCVPHALRAIAAILGAGAAPSEEAIRAAWGRYREMNRGLALEARRVLCEAFGTAAPTPDSMVGSLATVELPEFEGVTPGRPIGSFEGGMDALQDRLYEKWRIEVPIVGYPGPPRRLVRVAAQLYNTVEQVRYLGRAIMAEIGELRGR